VSSVIIDLHLSANALLLLLLLLHQRCTLSDRTLSVRPLSSQLPTSSSRENAEFEILRDVWLVGHQSRIKGKEEIKEEEEIVEQ